MRPLDNLTGKIAAFVEAAGEAAWPLPLERGESGGPMDQSAVTSPALDPAAFDFNALHDERGITAYRLDLAGTLKRHAGAWNSAGEAMGECLTEADGLPGAALRRARHRHCR
ncbi:hypothetical protein I6B53_03745 [Schaalia sp. 19OD2882]|uniref:hypothetical protein n=1 Tax=Schaalia sp. 19OD2882 TaxID=2794089 RepID=UPI001C1EDB82|nr:hypothetical protein [Schaalia sp. 19OD2882]QWW20220.1 hypothetical protein I6B53_03745 [Schaalia sp. 19OD2882]